MKDIDHRLSDATWSGDSCYEINFIYEKLRKTKIRHRIINIVSSCTFKQRSFFLTIQILINQRDYL